MKSNAYLINVGRGSLVKEADLFQALSEKWIAGAASDVFEKEPICKDNVLLALDNFIGTPHIAAHTEEAMKNSSIMLSNDVLAVLEGKQPKYPVPEYFYP